MALLPHYSLPDRYTLGPWQVHTSRDEVAGQGQVHKLEPRTMRHLSVLAQAGGEVVPANHLLNTVWPGLIVTPSSLYDAVALLRKVLGADHIATVPRKGYRLATAVAPQASSSAATANASDAPQSAAPQTGAVPAETAEPRLGARSVAVLPFVMRGLPEPLSFLSESLTGALISELSRQPGLAVVALGTMLTFGQLEQLLDTLREAGLPDH